MKLLFTFLLAVTLHAEDSPAKPPEVPMDVQRDFFIASIKLQAAQEAMKEAREFAVKVNSRFDAACGADYHKQYENWGLSCQPNPPKPESVKPTGN